MLSEEAKSEIRRHLGYPLIGQLRVSVGGQSLALGAQGWRYFQAYGFLEYKLNNLSAVEEARTLGLAIGSLAIFGNIHPGDTITVTISGGPLAVPEVLTVTAGARDD